MIKIYEIEYDRIITEVQGTVQDNNWYHIPDGDYYLYKGSTGFLDRKDAVEVLKVTLDNEIERLEKLRMDLDG